jgi:hypothetical protein
MMRNNLARPIAITALALWLCQPAVAQQKYDGSAARVSLYCLNSSNNAVPLFNSSGVWQCAGTAVPVTGTFTPSGTQDVNVKQWAGGALGAMANYGTSPGAVLVPGVNAFVTNPTPTTPPTSCSGTITSGGTAQSIIAAGTVHGFQLQNLSTDPLAFSWTTTTPVVLTNWTLNAGTATTAGGSYNSPLGLGITTAVYIIGATTGDKFSCAWW